MWQRTAVLIVTEFGRTAAANGTRGTDHGTGAAAFLMGGAVNGGRVISDWPGLADRGLYQGRDLKPTTDLRAVMKGVLGDHLQVPASALEREVFPDSAVARPMRDLIDLVPRPWTGAASEAGGASLPLCYRHGFDAEQSPAAVSARARCRARAGPVRAA
jgi:hypothetical protein